MKWEDAALEVLESKFNNGIFGTTPVIAISLSA